MFDSISIVIPAYNEEKVVESTLKSVTEYCAGKFVDYEVIVVDDCSKDKTRELASAFPSPKVRVIHNEVNHGKGYSVKKGVLESKNALVLFMDSDASLPIENLDVFLPYIEKGFDVVIASRNVSGAEIQNQQKHRRFLGRAFSFFVGLIVLRGYGDTQCGFKLFKGGAAKSVFSQQTLERFSFDVEVLFISKKKGYKIAEAPVKCVYCERSSVNPIKDSFRMLKDMLTIRFNDLLGRYNSP
jgi:dolichyl-phosphate beta-glucosyltransferase